MCRLGLCGKLGMVLSPETGTFTLSEKLLKRFGVNLEKEILKEANTELSERDTSDRSPLMDISCALQSTVGNQGNKI